MDVDELRRRLAAILAAGEGARADWAEVGRLKAELRRQLRAEPDTECPDVVTHFLEESDVPANDDELAAWQREEVRRFVETGGYTNRRAPVWTCPLILALIGGFVLWLVL